MVISSWPLSYILATELRPGLAIHSEFPQESVFSPLALLSLAI